jgi:outer membrane lipoprotein carrier protein
MTPVELAGKLQAAYDRTHDIKADFTQISEVTAMHIVKEGAGRLVIKKPGMLRYTYTRPDKQEIIVRDDELTMYMPESKTAVKRKMERAMLDKTPSTFLAGLGRITDSFDVRFPKAGSRDGDGNYLLELIPKGDSMGIKTVLLTLDYTNLDILGFSFTDVSGNTNSIRLKNIKTNKGVKDSVFDFELPKGTKLIAE